MTPREKVIQHLEQAHRLLATLEIPMSEYRPISKDILNAILKLNPDPVKKVSTVHGAYERIVIPEE